MLNTLKERLLDGMEIKKVKEKPSKYEITFIIGGKDITGELPKTCSPGCQNKVADQTIFNAKAKNAIILGNFEEGKMWLDKITNPSREERVMHNGI